MLKTNINRKRKKNIYRKVLALISHSRVDRHALLCLSVRRPSPNRSLITESFACSYTPLTVLLCFSSMDSDGDCGSDAGAEWVWVRRPAEAEAVAAAAGWPATDQEARPLKVVFASPARYFTDAAPIGNGRLGAMVWGGVESERLQLNRKSTAYP